MTQKNGGAAVPIVIAWGRWRSSLYTMCPIGDLVSCRAKTPSRIAFEARGRNSFPIWNVRLTARATPRELISHPAMKRVVEWIATATSHRK